MAVYVLDDDGTIEEVVREAFPGEDIKWFRESKPFIEALIGSRDIDLVVIDLVIQRDRGKENLFLARNPSVEGIYVLKEVKNILSEEITVVLATKFARDDIFEKAYYLGGIPLEIVDMETAIKKLRKIAPLISEDIEYLKKLAEKYYRAGFVAVSLKTLKVLELAEKFANSIHPILITGEVGVGKDALARAIAKVHKFPKFISFDIGNYSTHLDHLHAELFGVGSGVFTGVREHKGLFELVGKGALFLNEIGDLPLSLQGKLLEVLESGKFNKMGVNKPIQFEGKLILATNKNLLQMVLSGIFREDLYNRIFSHQIEIPPLRERREDIPELIKFRAPDLKFTSKARDFLVNRYRFPGNVRTLFKLLDRFLDYGIETVQLDDVIMATSLITKPQKPKGSITPEDILEFMLKERVVFDQLEEIVLKSAVKKFGLKWDEDTWGSLGLSRAKFFRLKKSGKLTEFLREHKYLS